jgi:hypothetical protein
MPPTDDDMLVAARTKLADHARLRRGHRLEDMDQAWIDARDELAARVVFYRALVGGEDRTHAKIHADQPYHSSNPYRLTIAHANGDVPLDAWAGPLAKKSTRQLDHEIAEFIGRPRRSKKAGE